MNGFTKMPSDKKSVGKKYKKTDHCWNLIKIDGYWCVLDATWGGGGYDQATQIYNKKLNPFWFLTDPYQFLYTH